MSTTQPAKPDHGDPNLPIDNEYVLDPEKDLLVWSSPNRPFKKRNKEYYSTIAMIVILVSLILFFAGQFLPIAVVISIAFVSYVLASVPPEKSHHRVTTYGIHTDQQFYYWEEMGRFWFTSKFGQEMVHVEVAKFPGTMTLLLGNQEKEPLKKLFMKYLIHETPLPSFLDKAADWMQEKIPLDRESASRLSKTK